MFNPSNNPETEEQSWRVFGRFQQSFGASGDEQSASTLKNAFFTLQADYSKDTESTYDVDHRDNLFNYGYIGKFTPVRELVENTPLEWQGEDNTIDIIGLDAMVFPHLVIHFLMYLPLMVLVVLYLVLLRI